MGEVIGFTLKRTSPLLIKELKGLGTNLALRQTDHIPLSTL